VSFEIFNPQVVLAGKRCWSCKRLMNSTWEWCPYCKGLAEPSRREVEFQPKCFGITSKNLVPHVLTAEEETFVDVTPGPSAEQLARSIYEDGK